MAQAPPVDLRAEISSDTILEVRFGKFQKLPGLQIESGIDKQICTGPVQVGSEGIDGDEHDLTFHGGPDKAIHAYCSSHYPTWASEFPTAASRFVPGGFGENFVVAQFNERNVCIGDTFAIGGDGGLVLQVSLPRQPCYKLNHRFHIKDFAPNTWKTSRTGWYFRVVQPGSVRAGDQMRLLDRPHPQWTIEKIQEYMHRTGDNVPVMEELAAIKEFGTEAKETFQNRINRFKNKEKMAQRQKEELRQWRQFKLIEKKTQTPRIASFVFEAVSPLENPDRLSPGAHVKLKLPSGLVRAYSVVDGTRNRFQLGISLDDRSRGGSRYLHETAQVDDVIEVGAFTNAVPIRMLFSNHVYVAAGVGITAFLAVVEGLRGINYNAVLHYAVRSEDEIPFKDRIEKLGSSAILYDKSKGQRMNIAAIIRDLPFNSHINFCGPKRMMDDAVAQVAASGLEESEVHYEAFEADVSGDPFEVVVENKNKAILKVGGEETLLEALQKQFGDEIPSSCEVGNCGTCKVKLKSGRVDHRGTALSAEEKTESMLSCVSRGIGRITIEV